MHRYFVLSCLLTRISHFFEQEYSSKVFFHVIKESKFTNIFEIVEKSRYLAVSPSKATSFKKHIQIITTMINWMFTFNSLIEQVKARFLFMLSCMKTIDYINYIMKIKFYHDIIIILYYDINHIMKMFNSILYDLDYINLIFIYFNKGGNQCYI